MAKSLEEKTSDALTEHAIHVNDFGNTFKRRRYKEYSTLLADIRSELLKGNEDISLGDVRKMMATANKLFKEGTKTIRTSIQEELEELLALDLEGQTELLQELMDEYKIPYDVREPSVKLATRQLKDTPVEDLPLGDWLDLWETKTNKRMQSGLLSETTGFDGTDRTRDELVYIVFSKNKDPFTADIFRRSGADMNGLLIAAIDATNSVASDSLAQANSGVIEGQVWNSVLETRTCARCASLHGAIRYLDGRDETYGNEIPLHPNCLCFWTYLYKDPKDMNVRVPKTAVSDVKSSTPLKKFEVWYNSISEKRKIELFGKTKYKMLESGDVTVNQLLTKSNRRVYTLQELRQKGYRVPE